MNIPLQTFLHYFKLPKKKLLNTILQNFLLLSPKLVLFYLFIYLLIYWFIDLFLTSPTHLPVNWSLSHEDPEEGLCDAVPHLHDHPLRLFEAVVQELVGVFIHG